MSEPMPQETIRDGVRYCRHHPEERITQEAYPCRLCIAEGCDGSRATVDLNFDNVNSLLSTFGDTKLGYIPKPQPMAPCLECGSDACEGC